MIIKLNKGHKERPSATDSQLLNELITFLEELGDIRNSIRSLLVAAWVSSRADCHRFCSSLVLGAQVLKEPIT